MDETNYDIITKEFADHKVNHDSTDWQLGYRQILRLLEPVNGQKILDFGCGSGDFGKKLTALGASVIGVDKSPEMVKLAQKTIQSSVYQEGKLRKQVGETTDIATINFVLCTIFDNQEVSRVLKDIAQTLQPKGRLMILEPNQEKSNGQEFRSFSYTPKNNPKSGDTVQVKFKDSNQLLLNDVYRPQFVYASLLEDAGFTINSIHEPTAPKDWGKEWDSEKNHPPFVIYEAVKK